MHQPTATTQAINLRRLLTARLVLLGGLLPGAWFLDKALNLPLRLAALTAVLGAGMVVTGASLLFASRRPGTTGNRTLVLQLGLDIVLLTVIASLSGGWTNPLVSLYLVPIAVAATSLSGRATWTLAALCVAAYGLLTRFYLPVFHLHGMDAAGFSLHVTGMWLTFVMAAVLVAYFGTTMAATLRTQERALVAAREQTLRNEQVLGVATLAAGTAHELSTPLASIAVIAAELEADAEGPTRDELRLLLDQVGTCRAALRRLRESASPVSEPLDAHTLLASVHDQFELLRPAVRLRCTLDPAATAPRLTVDDTLRQALLNLLDNAANASATVELTARWQPPGVRIDIADRGPGLIGAEAAASSGMGMGLLLANTSIERAGGSVRALPRPGGGTCVRVELPALQEAAA